MRSKEQQLNKELRAARAFNHKLMKAHSRRAAQLAAAQRAVKRQHLLLVGAREHVASLLASNVYWHKRATQ